MSDMKLKIGPLPNQKPARLNISVSPNLQADLQDYAAVYQRTYGHAAKVEDLVPNMLQTFLASDGGFKQARKQLSQHN